MKIDMTKLNKKADIVAAELEEARVAALEAATLAEALAEITALKSRVTALETE